MESFDEISINEAIRLYYEKHHALRQGDMNALIKLRNQHPQLFDKNKDAEIRDIIDYAKQFQSTPRYKELSRLDIKNKLTLIKNEYPHEDK